MKKCIANLVLLTVAALAVNLCIANENPGNARTKFTSSAGRIIEIDRPSNIISVPGRVARLVHDCSDDFQHCLTDGHGMSFSYFKKCVDSGSMSNYKRLRFRPRIVSVLHEHEWLIFDGAPRFMFHYVMGKGIVGIYFARKPGTDFRGLLKAKNFRVSSLDAEEYKIVSANTEAACVN